MAVDGRLVDGRWQVPQSPVLIAPPPTSKEQTGYAAKCALGLGATQIIVGGLMIIFHVSAFSKFLLSIAL